jgi:hypothetical protein
MSVMVEKSNIIHSINDNNLKEKEEINTETICDICFANTKNDLLKCKECSNSICFNCFNTSPLKSLGFENIDDKEKFEDGEGHLFHIQNCFFCRTKNYYRISNFEKKELNILTNNLAKSYWDLTNKYNDYIDDIRNTKYEDKNHSKIVDKTISYLSVKDERDELILRLNIYENLEENFLKMKEELNNITKKYNENIKDYNNFLKNTYKQIAITNEYICNQRDNYKNTYVNGINEIKSKNKNKNLDKFIDNKLKELNKQTTETELSLEIEFNDIFNK